MTLKRHEEEAGEWCETMGIDDDVYGPEVAHLISTAEARGREQAAKVCVRRAALGGRRGLDAHEASDCAAAIRAYKEEEP